MQSGGGGGGKKIFLKNQIKTILKTDCQKFSDAAKQPHEDPPIRPGDDETGIPREVLRRADKHGLRSDVIRAWIAAREKYGNPLGVCDALAAVEKYCTGINVAPERARMIFEGAWIAKDCEAERKKLEGAPLFKPPVGPLADVQSYLTPPPPELVAGAARLGVPPRQFLDAYHADHAAALEAVDALEESGARIKSPAAAFARNFRDKRQSSTTYRPKWRNAPAEPKPDVLEARRRRDAEILAVIDANVGKFCEVKNRHNTPFRLCLKERDNGQVWVERWIGETYGPQKEHTEWNREIQVPLRVFLCSYRNQIPVGGQWKPLAAFPEACAE